MVVVVAMLTVGDIVCHELRNPLNGIQASLELLRDEILSLQASIKQRYAEEETASSFTSILEHITNMNECARHQKLSWTTFYP